ncbi:leucine-rich repeat neuronal protein 4 [Brachyhypopomus gauderio]|uniref:leucine-rich repeat neuronal protein 4 n=1 Tax=Brachyhypopomus gauderio TaxID=698409 RepID=UPI0040424227
MFVVSRKPVTSLFIFFILTSTVTSSSPRTATLQPGFPRSPLNFPLEDDYENLSDEPVSLAPPTANPSAPRCKYNPCLDQQEPCRSMAAAQGCSCPGTSGPREVPEPPHLLRLYRGDPGGVLVHWCAPVSTVTSYRVWVEGQTARREVNDRTRVLDLGEVAVGAEVCVQAVNAAGVSQQESQACSRYQPHDSESTLALKLGVLGGVVVVVLLLVLALVLWRLRTRRNSRARAEAGGGGGGGEVL